MQTKLDSLPTGRFDREGDWEAMQFFSETDRELSPEEYAARRGHLWGCFSLHFYKYRDQVLGAWVKRVGHLFDHPDELEQVRERLLTSEERAKIRLEQAEEF